MKLAVSYSLYGTDDYYLRGLSRNADILQDVYPGAEMLVYTNRRVQLPGAHVIEMSSLPGSGGAFWRMLAAGFTEYDAVLFRDADSEVNVREAAAVTEWLESGLGLHAMLDHDAHSGDEWPVMAGMWASRPGFIPGFVDLVEWWIRNRGPFEYKSDQWFLRRYVYPRLIGDGMLHNASPGSRWAGRPFPDHPPYDGFVGERMAR